MKGRKNAPSFSDSTQKWNLEPVIGGEDDSLGFCPIDALVGHRDPVFKLTEIARNRLSAFMEIRL